MKNIAGTGKNYSPSANLYSPSESNLRPQAGSRIRYQCTAEEIGCPVFNVLFTVEVNIIISSIQIVLPIPMFVSPTNTFY